MKGMQERSSKDVQLEGVSSGEFGSVGVQRANPAGTSSQEPSMIS
jgi:hypothetical protein